MASEQQTIDQINRVRNEYFTRSPDRPAVRIRNRPKQSDAVRKAKSRLRTAAWRLDLDKRGRPETALVCIQFLVSLITVAKESGFEVSDLPETKSAFDALFDRMTEQGFRRCEVESVIKRLVNRSK